jgi:hypothetical protein
MHSQSAAAPVCPGGIPQGPAPLVPRCCGARNLVPRLLLQRSWMKPIHMGHSRWTVRWEWKTPDISGPTPTPVPPPAPTPLSLGRSCRLLSRAPTAGPAAPATAAACRCCRPSTLRLLPEMAGSPSAPARAPSSVPPIAGCPHACCCSAPSATPNKPPTAAAAAPAPALLCWSSCPGPPPPPPAPPAAASAA